MTVEITIRDESGKTLTTITGDASKPGQWKSQHDKPIDTGKYLLYGYSYVPIVTLKPLAANK